MMKKTMRNEFLFLTISDAEDFDPIDKRKSSSRLIKHYFERK
jgi:hypothetical protein